MLCDVKSDCGTWSFDSVPIIWLGARDTDLDAGHFWSFECWGPLAFDNRSDPYRGRFVFEYHYCERSIYWYGAWIAGIYNFDGLR